MDADRAFGGAVGEGGSEAWGAWFAEDGALIQPRVGEIGGRDEIRGYGAWLDDPQVSQRWEPARADIAASGDLGWTTGRFVSEGVDDNGQPTRGEGRYVSIWRRAADGSWKVVMDLGNPTSARPAAEGGRAHPDSLGSGAGSRRRSPRAPAPRSKGPSRLAPRRAAPRRPTPRPIRAPRTTRGPHRPSARRPRPGRTPS
jgi:ketosteroid isomerase-like protein